MGAAGSTPPRKPPRVLGDPLPPTQKPPTRWKPPGAPIHPTMNVDTINMQVPASCEGAKLASVLALLQVRARVIYSECK